jgi:YHS domain-containing protein
MKSMLQTIAKSSHVFSLAVALALSAPSACADEVSNYVKDGLVIGGIDPVAYFVEMRPVAGDPAFAIEWNGATWLFSSTTNRDAFVANPTVFAPQYGGYCALAMSYGKKTPIDPSAFKIIDGKLYLNASLAARKAFEADEGGTIARANDHWKRMEQSPAAEM